MGNCLNLSPFSKKNIDYNAEDGLERKEAEPDEDGVAVVIDEEDREDEDFEIRLIREESDEEEVQGDAENHWNIVEWAIPNSVVATSYGRTKPGNDADPHLTVVISPDHTKPNS